MNQFLPHLSLLILSLAFTAVKPSGLTASESTAAVSRFQEYLRIDTAQPSPDYAKAAAFITSQAEAIGLESQTLELVAGKPLVLLKWPGKKSSLPSLLLNSHTDVVPFETDKWAHHPFSAAIDSSGRIYARGSQDMKCVGMQYLEAIRLLKKAGFSPDRDIYITFVPDEEIGGHAGVEVFVKSDVFKKLNIGLVLDEGLASPGAEYRLFYGERSPWWTVIRSKGAPGHGAKLYDGSAMENLLKSIEAIKRFRTAQFDLVKAGVKAEGDVISINFVYLKAGTPSPTGFVMNLQPSEAEVGLDIRVPPSADPEALERRLAEEWAPSSRNLTYEFKQKVPVVDTYGKPAVTVADNSNPWWSLLGDAVKKAGGKLGKPEIFPASTDARYFRELGIPAFGFSPMANTPILLHDHNEVYFLFFLFLLGRAYVLHKTISCLTMKQKLYLKTPEGHQLP
ncbi:Aminoacylase [Rhynchospora pubera]|uniref:N-acyl-aliphatic-L-amino acid amidohydrolase n=1 Tax=Rhynchospora pubera TaxID=906938 RepID=A0AAV8BZM3_9POAL|nr:Aminoacylase [Rhynchospora pubera]